MTADDAAAFLDRCDDVLTDWHGSRDAMRAHPDGTIDDVTFWRARPDDHRTPRSQWRRPPPAPTTEP